jgi:hypothetical protein
MNPRPGDPRAARPEPRADPAVGFVPAVVRRWLAQTPAPTPRHEQHDGVALVADVVDSTGLAVALAGTGAGSEQLRTLLDAALGPVIEAVVGTGGDVLAFVGDGLHAFWVDADPATVVSTARAAQQRSVAAADPRVRIRIGLAGGRLDLWSLGGHGGRWLCVAGGPALVAADHAQAAVPPGCLGVTQHLAAHLDGAFTTTPGAEVHLVHTAPPPPEHTAGTPGPRAPDSDDVHCYLPEVLRTRHQAEPSEYHVCETRTISALFVRVPELTTSAQPARIQAATVDLQRFLSGHQATLLRISVDEQGAIALVVFGTPPHADEDDADRALAAAVHLDDDLRRQGLRHGLGLARGSVFCGTVGTPTRRDWTVIGEAPNLAARLARVALQPDRPTLMCDTRTRAEVAARWEFRTPLSLRLRGRNELVTGWTPATRHVRPARATAQMVGRSSELADLQELVRGLQPRAPGSVTVICGDAGMGKSRLLAELVATTRDRHVLIGHADPLAATTAYHPWRPVLRALLELHPDPAGDRRDRTDPARAEHIAALAAVLPTGATTPPAAAVRPDAVRAAVAAEVTAAVVRAGPLVIALEDAHWFDTASWATLAQVAELDGVAVLLTSRPPSTPPGSPGERLLAGPRTRVLQLAPLSAQEVGALAASTLAAPAHDLLRTLLVQRCVGNPFFTVETLVCMRRSGALTTEAGTITLTAGATVTVPDTIQAAITSRIDRLTDDQRLTLKVASVIGDPVTEDLLEAIHPLARPRTAIVEDLAGLTRAHLLTTDPMPGRYRFKHALTAEAAHALLPVGQRRNLHRDLARHHERNSDTRSMAAVLAAHWRQAEDDQRSLEHLRVAVVEAIANGMPTEAVAHAVAAAQILGLDLSTDRGAITAALPAELDGITALMAGRRPADLEELPELLDPVARTSIEIMFRAMPAASTAGRPELFALMAARAMNLTLRYGAGEHAPGVYAMYSIVVRSLGGAPDTALEFSELAMRADPTAGGRLTAPVNMIHAWFHHHWHRPLAAAVPIALHAARTGFASGDELFGAYGYGAAITLAAVCGTHLEQVIAFGTEWAPRVETASAMALFHCRLETQVAKALSGRTAGLDSLTDSWCDESELSGAARTSPSRGTTSWPSVAWPTWPATGRPLATGLRAPRR